MSTANNQSDAAVFERYAAAAQEREEALCCPVSYAPELLEMLPAEIVEKDYGCGDPSAYLKPGEDVLDLGSGGGKLCYMASQIVGESGSVVGVDVNQEMLGLARKYQTEMAEKLGYANVEFRYGQIQDLGLDLDQLNTQLDNVAASPSRPFELLGKMRDLRSNQPMIPDDSIDCVISNCVLNLVNPDDRKQLFQEIYRVLRTGGRAVISDIVSDEDVPQSLQNDGKLWSGCISGAWREDRFVDEFINAGFQAVAIDKYQVEPWQVVEGIQFRSVTVVAYKPIVDVCLERNQAVIYKGPFSHVKDDDGHLYRRGQRIAVCDKMYRELQTSPYSEMFVFIDPLNEIPLESAKEFDCSRTQLRSPRETKGLDYSETLQIVDGCEPGSECC